LTWKDTDPAPTDESVADTVAVNVTSTDCSEVRAGLVRSRRRGGPFFPTVSFFEESEEPWKLSLGV
jgi:hypothetical protein